jgi:hypothetical protein
MYRPPSGGQIWGLLICSMMVEMDARMSTHKDFAVRANANPDSRQSLTWNLYEAQHQALAGNSMEGVRDEHPT